MLCQSHYWAYHAIPVAPPRRALIKWVSTIGWYQLTNKFQDDNDDCQSIMLWSSEPRYTAQQRFLQARAQLIEENGLYTRSYHGSLPTLVSRSKNTVIFSNCDVLFLVCCWSFTRGMVNLKLISERMWGFTYFYLLSLKMQCIIYYLLLCVTFCWQHAVLASQGSSRSEILVLFTLLPPKQTVRNSDTLYISRSTIMLV